MTFIKLIILSHLYVEVSIYIAAKLIKFISFFRMCLAVTVQNKKWSRFHSECPTDNFLTDNYESPADSALKPSKRTNNCYLKCQSVLAFSSPKWRKNAEKYISISHSGAVLRIRVRPDPDLFGSSTGSFISSSGSGSGSGSFEYR
jgi:hypothetical protein